MGHYVNNLSSVSIFEELSSKSHYVDKSEIVKVLDGLLCLYHELYLCISRPAGFGKTSVLHLLNAYYCKKSSCNSKKFSYINQDFHKFNIISLNMSEGDPENYTEFIDRLSREVVSELKQEFPEYSEYFIDNCDIEGAICTILEKSEFRENFILLVDEWDFYVRKCRLSEMGEKKVVWFYNVLTKSSVPFYFSIFFGIYPQNGYSIDTLANNIDDYSVLWDKKFNKCIGFTVDEVKSLVTELKSNLKIDDLLNWYGYSINEEKVMNSASIINAIRADKITSYWKSTVYSKKLINLLLENGEDTWKRLIAGEDVEFSRDSVRYLNSYYLNKEHPTKTIYELLHSGYLCIDSDNFLKIPNKDVLQEFMQ